MAIPGNIANHQLNTPVVPVPLDVILKDKSAINVHKSAAEMQVYVSCGNIVGAIQR